MATLMLVTLLWWQIQDVGDRIPMMATFLIILVIFSRIKSVTNILNGLPTSQSSHQHISSPTPVTNIDVASSETSYSVYHPVMCLKSFVLIIAYCFFLIVISEWDSQKYKDG